MELVTGSESARPQARNSRFVVRDLLFVKTAVVEGQGDSVVGTLTAWHAIAINVPCEITCAVALAWLGVKVERSGRGRFHWR